MAILNFHKPDKIIFKKQLILKLSLNFVRWNLVMVLPLVMHLRRVLLNSLEGYAIVGVKIEGVDHEFATMKGISEDVVEIFLNLKQVRFKKKLIMKWPMKRSFCL